MPETLIGDDHAPPAAQIHFPGYAQHYPPNGGVALSDDREAS
ncbi:hypothetical protein [Micromonospora zamorensis]